MVELSNPNLASIQQKILTDSYTDKLVNINLKVYVSENDQDFGISLKIKSAEVNIEFDTRVALERHEKGHKHNQIHIQGDIKETTLDFFKKGELRIFLDVSDDKQLVTACEGFSFAIVDILLMVEKILGYNKMVLVHTFFAKDIIVFKPNKAELHNLIADALKSNNIELKARKSNDYSRYTLIRKILIMILLFEDVQMLKPIFKKPVYETFVEIPEIKRLGLTIKEHEKNVKQMIKDKKELHKFTVQNYILEINTK